MAGTGDTAVNEFLEVQQSLRTGRRSWYDTIDLDDARRASLDAALADKAITARAIQIVLARWGHKVGVDSIRHFRREANA